MSAVVWDRIGGSGGLLAISCRTANESPALFLVKEWENVSQMHLLLHELDSSVPAPGEEYYPSELDLIWVSRRLFGPERGRLF